MHSLKIILSKFKYFSVAWIFASLNFIIGTWVLYIPHVKEKLQLNDSQIGIALFCFAFGILLFLLMVPFIKKKSRYRAVCCHWRYFICNFFCLFLLLAPSYMLLCFFICCRYICRCYRFCHDYFSFLYRERRCTKFYLGSTRFLQFSWRHWCYFR